MTTKQVRNYSDDSQENFGGSQLLVYFCILHTSVCLSHQYTIILMLASIIGNIATYVHRIFSINIHRPDHHNKALCMYNKHSGQFFSVEFARIIYYLSKISIQCDDIEFFSTKIFAAL